MTRERNKYAMLCICLAACLSESNHERETKKKDKREKEGHTPDPNALSFPFPHLDLGPSISLIPNLSLVHSFTHLFILLFPLLTICSFYFFLSLSLSFLLPVHLSISLVPFSPFFFPPLPLSSSEYERLCCTYHKHIPSLGRI